VSFASIAKCLKKHGPCVGKRLQARPDPRYRMCFIRSNIAPRSCTVADEWLRPDRADGLSKNATHAPLTRGSYVEPPRTVRHANALRACGRWRGRGYGRYGGSNSTVEQLLFGNPRQKQFEYLALGSRQRCLSFDIRATPERRRPPRDCPFLLLNPEAIARPVLRPQKAPTQNGQSDRAQFTCLDSKGIDKSAIAAVQVCHLQVGFSKGQRRVPSRNANVFDPRSHCGTTVPQSPRFRKGQIEKRVPVNCAGWLYGPWADLSQRVRAAGRKNCSLFRSLIQARSARQSPSHRSITQKATLVRRADHLLRRVGTGMLPTDQDAAAPCQSRPGTRKG